MTCENQVGVRNLMIGFVDCDTDETIAPISHELAADQLPTVNTCGYNNEATSNGYARRNRSNAMMSVAVIRDLGIPMAYYQGCASINISIEYYNGLVYTGVNGTVTGEPSSDTHEVEMEIVFRVQDIDEILPRQVNQPLAA